MPVAALIAIVVPMVSFLTEVMSDTAATAEVALLGSLAVQMGYGR